MTTVFHAKDNWHFWRTENGSVVIEKRLPILGDVHDERDDEHDYIIQDQVVFTQSVWASIVANVSAGGETGKSWAEAMNLHAGKIVAGALPES